MLYWRDAPAMIFEVRSSPDGKHLEKTLHRIKERVSEYVSGRRRRDRSADG